MNRYSEAHEKSNKLNRSNVDKSRQKLRFTERGQPNGDVNAKCNLCNLYFTIKGLKTHEAKCLDTEPHVKVLCHLCNDLFKKNGIKNHLKTCRKFKNRSK